VTFRRGGKVPVYEYECEACGHAFTLVLGIAEHDKVSPACPKCRSAKVHQCVSAVHVQTSRKS
jgi:putative FmdB family regulatory protein